MPSPTSDKWYHSNLYPAEAACEHCSGIVRHQPWCVVVNALVNYAYETVLDAGKLTMEDQLILHALGVEWRNRECSGACKAEPVTA